MKNSEKRIEFITSYISAYEEKIKLLNKEGLFDSAKLFELFAIEVGSLLFGQRLSNLNTNTFAYPCVDLISDDKQIYIQVSTEKNIPSKIKATLERIRDSQKQEMQNIKHIKFIVLNNESVDKVKDFAGKNQIGNISFCKKDDLITTQDILRKAMNDLNFQIALYNLLKNEVESIKDNSYKLQEAIEDSKNVGLSSIDCKINNEYEIDRSELISKIKEANHKNISIQGDAGSGKSVLCKKLVEDTEILLYARAERFSEETDINNIWGFNIRRTLECLNGKSVVFFIDALEFIADNRTKLDLLTILYECTKKYDKVHIVTSCRTSDKSAFMKIEANYSVGSYEIGELTLEEISAISAQYPIIGKMARLNSYQQLLKSPLYIDIIVKKIHDFNDITDENQLREYIWQHVICMNDSRYKEIINSIVITRAKNFSVGVNVNKYESKIIQKMISEGILVQNDRTVRLKYDVFEDICFEQYFDELFDECKGNYAEFFAEIETLGRCVYRRYQIWIENKLLAKNNRQKFLYGLIFAESMPSFWRKQTEIGLVKSRHSNSFFEDYGTAIIQNKRLNEFIGVANLYAFEVRNDIPISDRLWLRPCGEGRRSLIHLIVDNKLYERFNAESSGFVKLCADYSNVQIKEKQTAEESCVVLFHVIDKYLSEFVKKDYTKLGEHINGLLEPVYRMTEYATDWIKSFWKKLVALYQSGKRDNELLSEDIIDYTLKFQHWNLAKFLPLELCQLAETYWTYSPKKKKGFPYYQHDKYEIYHQYGLNEKTDSYKFATLRNDAQKSNFFCSLFRNNFWKGLGWAIEFVNKAIANLSNNTKGGLQKYDVFFIDENITRSYMGHYDMWLITTKENTMPLILSDLIFCLKEEILKIIYADGLCDEDKKRFANIVKKVIYERANNIALLTIISEIGLSFKEKLPGYALDLASNIDIILNDITRYTLSIKNPLKEMLETQVLISVGLPYPLPDRYNRKNSGQYHLRQYVCDLQLDSCEEIKNKCTSILDYLYDIVPNDEENATSYLQIQLMDLRRAKKIAIDENVSLLIPTVSGEAEKTMKEQEKINRHDNDIFSLIEDFNKKVAENKIDKVHCLKLIEIIAKEARDNIVPVMYQKLLIQLITFALQMDLHKKDRERLCKMWVDGIYKFFSMESFTFDLNLSSILFSQVEANISMGSVIQIKQLMLDLLLYEGENGVIRQIARFAKKYLGTNKKLALAMFNTIVKLAEDEMNHQKFNAEYLKAREQDDEGEEYEFSPNAQPKLRGVDCYIEQDNADGYRSEHDKVVDDYLYGGEELDLSSFNINNYDIATICYALNCGITLEDAKLVNIVKQIVMTLIDIWQKEGETHYYHPIIGGYQEYEVQEFLQRELIASETQMSYVLDILFDDIDFSKFTRSTIEFYQDVFGGLLVFYFDSHNNSLQRTKCEKIISALEQKVLAIKEERIRIELFKSLILSITRYGGSGDWRDCPSGYSYQDKQFLNQMFSKYGGFHLKEMIDVICKLHMDKLLPEILLSLRDALQKVRKEKKDEWKKTSFESIIYEKKILLLMIISKSFLNCNAEIKLDEELIKAFEDILEMLVDVNFEEAAVILDEFRVH